MVNELADELSDILPRLAAMMKRRKDMPEFDAEYTDDYADAIDTIGATVEELRYAKKMILAKEEWFPAPSNFCGYILEARRMMAELTKRSYWDSLVLAIHPDRDGQEVLAPPHTVHDGVYREGTTDGNGVSIQQVKALSPRSRADVLASMSPGGRALLASVTQSGEPAAVPVKRI